MSGNVSSDLDVFGDGQPPVQPRRDERKGRRRGRKSLIIFLIAVLVVLGAAFAGVLWLQHRLDSAIERIDDPFEALPTRAPAAAVGESGEQPMNMLVLGTDSRVSAGDPNQWSYGAQRTDAIMLLHIPGDRSGAYVMSFPRDTWVDIPGWGPAKINAAFSYGGPTLLIQTFEQLTGIYVDHFAVADFESFSALTDAVGGVDIMVSEDTYAGQGSIPLAAGTHHMDGETALAYARERYNLPGGDFDRVKRQQNWMRAIARSAMDRDVLTNPARLNEFLTTAVTTVAVDEALTIGAMRDLALSMRDVREGDMVFLTIPVTGTGTSADGQSIVLRDEALFDEVMAAITADEFGAFMEERGEELTLLGESVR